METFPIILYDGYCNLCSGTVQFILQRDPKKRFRFAAIHSKFAQKTLLEVNALSTQPDTFILLENGNVYTRSTGALRVLRYLNGMWPLLYALIIIPPFLRDYIYSIISKNRYRWFGKKESCWIPDPTWKDRFLE